MKTTSRKDVLRTALLAAAACALGGLARAQGAPGEAPFTVDYYYKARWGQADEFLRLFKKNHYPVLKKQVESGRLVSVSAVRPRYHATEDGRWDYRVTLVFRSVAAAHDNTGEEAIVRALYPDQETFRREEQRRFEILEAHWDVPLVPVELER
jgi:hypothetical protein